MLEHHIQKDIIRRLATTNSLRFSELKPDEIENKAFDYHLKQLLRDNLVEKSEDGSYQLTAFGRKVSVSAGGKLSERVERAFSVLFLIIRDNTGRWLMYKRRTHPLINRIGFMHARPTAYETIAETASRTLFEKTGLEASFKVRAHGYFRMFEDGDLESFTHFTILDATSVDGELTARDEHAEYAWYEDPNFLAPEMLPNMADIIELYNDSGRDFLEKTYKF